MRIAWMMLVLTLATACNKPSGSPAPPPPLTGPVASEQPDSPNVMRPRSTGRTPPLPSPDLRSKAEIDVAACTAANGAWRCASKKPQTFAASATQPITPASWSVPAWFVDRTSGDDANSCTSSGSPCKTKQEIIVHRWGCFGYPSDCPIVSQNTTITQLTADTDATDPWILHSAVMNGASLILKGTTPTVLATVSLSGVVAKNLNAGANTLLQANLGGTAVALTTLLHNRTHDSYAWTYTNVSGTTFNVSQPTGPQTPGISLNLSMVDTWANNNTVDVLAPTPIYISEWSNRVLGLNQSTFSNGAFGYQLSTFDPAGGGNNTLYTDGITWEESFFQMYPFSHGLGTPAFVNTDARFGMAVLNNGSSADFVAGIATTGGSNTSGFQMDNNANFNTLGGGVIFGSASSQFGAVIVGGRTFVGGQTYLDCALSILGGGVLEIDEFEVNATVIYGSAQANLFLLGQSTLSNNSGIAYNTIVTAAPLRTCVTMNGLCTSCRVNQDGGLTPCGLANTPAQFDTTLTTSGLSAGRQFVPGGAAVGNHI